MYVPMSQLLQSICLHFFRSFASAATHVAWRNILTARMMHTQISVIHEKVITITWSRFIQPSKDRTYLQHFIIVQLCNIKSKYDPLQLSPQLGLTNSYIKGTEGEITQNAGLNIVYKLKRTSSASGEHTLCHLMPEQ